MASTLDQAAGWGLVSIAGFVFTYYSIWVIVLPFVDPDQPIHQYFLDRFYAVAGPLVAGVILLMIIGALIVHDTMKSRKKVKTS
ncbi:dolichol phosphate-mannose biosynthesis regulatory protein [Aplysia californica]|uniref:Dolichol phosphate-mannose biosynthesis regulatory protein n=1 Tax=Aplysia californica TaxID=6500 RepID=A0ABM0JFY3_APLCA|nr:dolichol phosphate-mannose biosynthesis regulatory protein [Aplysia californica]